MKTYQKYNKNYKNECLCLNLMAMAFISRHKPTDKQESLANSKGFSLYHVGDTDAFSITPKWVFEQGKRLNVSFFGVAVVHPAAALRLQNQFTVGIFENANRAEEGQPPQFEARSLHLYYGWLGSCKKCGLGLHRHTEEGLFCPNCDD